MFVNGALLKRIFNKNVFFSIFSPKIESEFYKIIFSSFCREKIVLELNYTNSFDSKSGVLLFSLWS